MLSSDEYDDDILFPVNDGPSTPLREDNGNTCSDLSPPDSQSRAQASNFALNSNGKRALSTTSHLTKETGTASKYLSGRNGDTAPAEKPGWSWKNKRAQEDHARALESIIDKERMIGSKPGINGVMTVSATDRN